MDRLTGFSSSQRPRTLTQSAYLLIQQAIRDGTLSQGQLYSENELAESLGMSRTPVREALITLAREGIIQTSAQRGFEVCQITDAQRQEIFDLRLLVEPYVVRRLASVATDDDIGRLSALVDEQEGLPEGASQATFLALDEEFHLLMSQIAGLSRTFAIMASLRGMMWLIGSEALASPDRRPSVIAEHRAVLAAIARHDADAAAMAIHDHIVETAKTSSAGRRPATPAD